MANLLIIDDDSAITQTMRRLLELEGHTVHTARNGFEGLERVVECAPDAIVLDVRMPVVNGLVFLRALRARTPSAQIPVVIITGDYFLDQTVSDELLTLGAAVYFKPVWVREVARILERLLRQRQ